MVGGGLMVESVIERARPEDSFHQLKYEVKGGKGKMNSSLRTKTLTIPTKPKCKRLER